ncbi:MAG: N-acetylmuramoyl-L-alanine amidase [Henriciella sp.]|nr:N-acetylmuramoyl-L-alanine amidase [Henriciella sp.]MBO6695810.1 N-acetylmuramoyl-L-alanine amidase [Henriciella sp.]
MKVICLFFVSAWLAATGAAQVQSIGIAGDGEFTRITITSENAIRPDIFLRETVDGMVIEMVPDVFELSAQPFYSEPTGGIYAYTLDKDRVVFELDRPMMVMREIDLPPSGSERLYRFILDLSGVSEARFRNAARRDETRFARFEAARAASPETPASVEVADVVPGVRPDAPSSKPVSIGALMQMAARQRRVIVIDPGHGGRDPGALAIVGGKESDIVLKTSLKLKQMIEQDPRYVVRLTRETDIYVEHEDRVAMARNWGADLFISVHADAAGAPTVSGASVYTISTRGEARIEGTAKKFGWELPIEDGTSVAVSNILQDLTLRETKSNSSIFAEFLVPELGKAGPLVRNSHRQGNLFVLLAPDVPAVLVEIGFLTNRNDARRLKSERGRRKSAEAIKRAIDAYFDRQDLILATN